MTEYVKVDYGLQIDKGKCMFARKDIKQGERIIQEKPIMSFGHYTDLYEIYSRFLGLNPHSRDAILDLSSRLSQERHYLSRINKQDFRQIWSLCQDRRRSGTVPASKEEAAKVLAVFDDNQVQLQYESRPELALQIARINHSCTPNVAIAWNSKLRRYTVHALMDIKTGEEILCSYVYLPEPRECRQEQLKRWEIECKCSACDFENVGKEEQKQDFIENDEKDERRASRPDIKRRSTGDLNVMWYKQPTAQSSENRRWQWKIWNESMNSTHEDRKIIGRAATYEDMIDFLGPEEEMLEERIRLHIGFIHECEQGEDDRERDPCKIASAYTKAIHFAKICYGPDSETIQDLQAGLE